MRTFYLLAISILISGCFGGVSGVILNPAGSTTSIGGTTYVMVTGQGQCGGFSIDWGDDTPPQQAPAHDFQNPFYATHTYSGWGGGKTVTVTPTTSCGGYARLRFKLEPTAPISLAWNRRPTDNAVTCNAVPPAPAPLASRSLLHVTGDPTPVFNFSCANNGCIYDPDGRPGSVAASPFPFPGMREYSLVVKVGSQSFQGGKSTNITVPQGGTLRVCQNTDNPAGAVGGWGIYFAVDQLGP
jgi:hypothetical protein